MLENSYLNRRTLLTRLAILPAAATGASIAAPAWAEAAASSAGLVSSNVCLVAPEVTEGPYYFDPDLDLLDRKDITEGLDGVKLEVKIQVVDSACNPIADARVDIWHCDAEGNYSGYATQGSSGVKDTSNETFLRGTQTTDVSGIVTFDTIYPGWYASRTTHIHYKVFLDEKTVLTSQIFFPDALSQYLFENIRPYNNRAASRDTLNVNDGIAQQAGEGAYAAIRERADMYSAGIVVGVDPNAISSDAMFGGGGGDRPMGGPPPEGDRPEASTSGDNKRMVPGN